MLAAGASLSATICSAAFITEQVRTNHATAATVSAEAGTPSNDLPEPNEKQLIIQAARKAQKRQQEHAASRSEQRRSLTPNRYWFGDPAYFNALTLDEKHNALILYQVGIALNKTVSEIGCTDNVAYRESHVRVHDPNPTSEADGIPQANPASKMASAGPDWATNAATQVRWMFGYEDQSYGGACNAWQHWLANGNY